MHIIGTWATFTGKHAHVVKCTFCPAWLYTSRTGPSYSKPIDRDIFIIRTVTADAWRQESSKCLRGANIWRGCYLLLLNIVGSRLSALSGYMCPSDGPIRPQPHCFLQTERWPVGKESAFCPMLQLHLQFQSSILSEASYHPVLRLSEHWTSKETCQDHFIEHFPIFKICPSHE